MFSLGETAKDGSPGPAFPSSSAPHRLTLQGGPDGPSLENTLARLVGVPSWAGLSPALQQGLDGVGR